MIIKKNEKENLPVEEEIFHIIEQINKCCDKLKVNNMCIFGVSRNNDVFFQIFLKYKNKFRYPLYQYSEYENTFRKWDLDRDFPETVKDINSLLFNGNIALINTDTAENELLRGNKINYNIKVFSDYSQQYVQEIYNFIYPYNKGITLENNISEEKQNYIRDYLILSREELLNKYTKEELKYISITIQKTIPEKLYIYNSVTTNYLKDVNNDLEDLV